MAENRGRGRNVGPHARSVSAAGAPAEASSTALAARLTAEADDPERVRKALDDAATMARNLWLGFLTFGTYLVIAVGSVTHRDLFLEKPISFPFSMLSFRSSPSSLWLRCCSSCSTHTCCSI